MITAWTKPVTLDQMLKRNVRLPACPVVFARLMAILGHPEGHGGEVARVISTDPALTAQLLRVANSAAYGLTRRVRSVEEATLRLGFDEVWSIANAIAGKTLFQEPGKAAGKLHERLWQHSLTTAILVRALSKRLNVQSSDVYFTAGILHDLAKLALHQFDPQYAALCKDGESAGQDLIAAERETYGTQHAVLGGELLRRLNIPETIAVSVQQHHDVFSGDDRSTRMRALLSNCDTIAHALTALCGEGQLTFSQALPSELLASADLDEESWSFISAGCQHQLLALADVRTIHLVE